MQKSRRPEWLLRGAMMPGERVRPKATNFSKASRRRRRRRRHDLLVLLRVRRRLGTRSRPGSVRRINRIKVLLGVLGKDDW